MNAISKTHVRLPCGTSSARTNHLAHGQLCSTCFPDDPPLATVTPIRAGLDDTVRRHPAGKGLRR